MRREHRDRGDALDGYSLREAAQGTDNDREGSGEAVWLSWIQVKHLNVTCMARPIANEPLADALVFEHGSRHIASRSGVRTLMGLAHYKPCIALPIT